MLNETEASMVLHAWSAEESPGEYLRKLRTHFQKVGIGSLIKRAKEHGFDASAFARRRAERRLLPRRLPMGSTERSGLTGPKPSTMLDTESLPAMPDRVRASWEEGFDHLQRHPETLAQIDTWRSWPAGTAATLADDHMLSCVSTGDGKRGLAFPVQSPERCKLGYVQARQVGYHVRHKPPAGKRAKWSFHPNAKQDCQSTPGLPFVIGAGFVLSALIVIVCEGPWDAITLAAAGGWLVNDASWPENVVLFGTRGANGWRALWHHWRPFMPAGVAFVLFPDADEAGAIWTNPSGF
ncbi:MAG TPA: hypothetical protein PKX00_09350, partial [Opitutaceae bacterium]|nr:hypothetical protein [Opitutaceae bacterium]